MHHVLKHLAAGDFHHALVELFGLGCACDADGVRYFDAWPSMGTCSQELEAHLARAISADDYPAISLLDAMSAPLVLLREIERRLCQTTKFVASSQSECNK